MNEYEDQLIAIRTMLSESDRVVRMEGYDQLFNLWIRQEDQKKFFDQIIPIALEHDDLLKELENRINELVIRDNITDVHLRKLHKTLSAEVARAGQEIVEKDNHNKRPKEARGDISIVNKQGDETNVSNSDDSKFTKERWEFTFKSFLLPVGVNLIITALMYRFNAIFFEISWKPGFALIFLVSILFLNILLTDRAGQKNPIISNWIYFKKFHDFRNWISSMLAIIFLGILTNIVSDIIQGR